ncbi:MAG: hypothetical protein RL092_1806 [Bacteroidota bacterium]|jgi:hypothetical protein
MNDTLIQKSAALVGQTVSQEAGSSLYLNWWMWLALIEFVVIVFLLLNKRGKPNNTAKRRFKEDALDQDIDFDNIINSSFNSAHLYDELKVKCHPDRFPTDMEKNAIAVTLFQEISKNRNNVKRLLELKEEAIQKLNINQ